MACRVNAEQFAALAALGMPVPAPAVTRRGARVRPASVDLGTLLVLHGLPRPEPEYRFHKTRLWRWDYCWPDRMLAVEVQGGTWAAGKHVRGAGYENDCRKMAEGVLLGWRVLWVTRRMLADGTAVGLVRRALAAGPSGGVA